MKLLAHTTAVMAILSTPLFSAMPSHAEWVYNGESGNTTENGTGEGLYFISPNGNEHSRAYEAHAYAPPSSCQGTYAGTLNAHYLWNVVGIFSVPDIPSGTHQINFNSGASAESVVGTSASGLTSGQMNISGNSTISSANATKSSSQGAVVSPDSRNDPKTVFHYVSGSSGSFTTGFDFSITASAQSAGSVSGPTEGRSGSEAVDTYNPN